MTEPSRTDVVGGFLVPKEFVDDLLFGLRREDPTPAWRIWVARRLYRLSDSAAALLGDSLYWSLDRLARRFWPPPPPTIRGIRG